MMANIKQSVARFFKFSLTYCNTKLEVDYRFPLHFYLLNALSLLCGLLRAIGLRHRGPLINNSVNTAGDDKAFYLGLRETSDSSISIFLLTEWAFIIHLVFPGVNPKGAAHFSQQHSQRSGLCVCRYFWFVLFIYFVMCVDLTRWSAGTKWDKISYWLLVCHLTKPTFFATLNINTIIYIFN